MKPLTPRSYATFCLLRRVLKSAYWGQKLTSFWLRRVIKLTNKKRLVVDVRILNSLLPTPNVITLPKLHEIKSKLHNHFISSLDIANMFFFHWCYGTHWGWFWPSSATCFSNLVLFLLLKTGYVIDMVLSGMWKLEFEISEFEILEFENLEFENSECENLEFENSECENSEFENSES